jgi:vitamin B12 transporter
MANAVSVAFLSVSLPFVCVPAFAQDADADELIVTATRAAGGVPRASLGASVTTLGADDLKERQVRSLADALRDVPGVAVSRAGPLGAATQVRLRGTEANHVLVLVDGIEVTDPFLGEYDFSSLQVDEHARIEVLRGPQSALYGSDAIGGVIHYLTQSGREAPGLSARVEGGSFGTAEFAARLAGVAGDVDYAVTGGAQDADGTPTARSGVRDIGASNRTLSGRVGWQPGERVALRGVLRVSRANADFNPQDFDFTSPTYGFVIDGDDRARTRSVQGLLAADFGGAGDRLHQTLSVQGVDASRDAWAAGSRQSGAVGRRVKGSYVATVDLPGTAVAQQLTLAVDRENESFRNNGPFASPAQSERHSLDNTGLVAQYDGLIGEHTGFGFALRRDANELFSDATTFRALASHSFGATRVRLAAGSGLKNPSPTELFGYDPATFVGNPALRPEKSRGWEVGAEQRMLDERALLGFTWAQARLTDEIYTRFSPSFVSSPDNRAERSHQRSLEGYGRVRLGTQWRIDAAYTWLRAREAGQEEVRRPPHSGSLNALWQTPAARLGLNLTVRFNGATDDFNFTASGPPRVRLDSYTLVQVGGRYALTPQIELYGRVDNVLAERYEDVYTYRMPGRGGFAGLRARF